MSAWKRHRHPDDVPTPIAVAVADFCRRAKAAAPPAVVRAALSLLEPDEDQAVRTITDASPPSTPLGPFAVVDLVRGTSPLTASSRQQSGYYEMIRVATAGQAFGSESNDFESMGFGPMSPTDDRGSNSPRRNSTSDEKGTQRRTTKRGVSAGRRPPKPSLSDKIAPRRRVKGSEPTRPAVPPKTPATAFLPKRRLPTPRGRYTRIDSSRSSYESLLKAETKESLATIVEQSPTRFHVYRTLEPGYTGRAGQPLTVAETESALTRHHLLAALERKERDLALGALATARGSFPLAAKELGLKADQLDRLVVELSLKREMREIQERFIREALAPSNLNFRLQLLFRARYLADLKIEKRFSEALVRDLTRLLDESVDATSSAQQLVSTTAKKYAMVEELLLRAVEKLGLTQRYTR